MNVINTHRRLLHASPERVGKLIDALSSPNDGLWPHGWPRMKLDRPLGVGAKGGHGPIRYFVEAYEPGQSIRFRFTGPKGFDGWHGYDVLEATPAHCILEHRLEMQTRGPAVLMWPLLYRPLHDALLEDSLAAGETALGLERHTVPWSPYIRLLRRLVAPGGARQEGSRHAS